MHLPGVGPKKTRLLWETAGVVDLSVLERACREGRIREIPGMGEKTEAKILARHRGLGWPKPPGVPVSAVSARVVEPQAVRLVEALRAMPEVVAADYAGSLRRLRPTVRDIDLVAASSTPAAVMDAFAALPELARVDERGDTKLVAKTHTDLGVDLRIVPPESYGDLLQHFTGSADHNVALRGHAQRRGYKISEYGVEHVESGRLFTCATETEVYETGGSDLHTSRAAREPGGDRGG